MNFLRILIIIIIVVIFDDLQMGIFGIQRIKTGTERERKL